MLRIIALYITFRHNRHFINCGARSTEKGSRGARVLSELENMG